MYILYAIDISRSLKASSHKNAYGTLGKKLKSYCSYYRNSVIIIKQIIKAHEIDFKDILLKTWQRKAYLKLCHRTRTKFMSDCCVK